MDKNPDSTDDFSDLETLFQETVSICKPKAPRHKEKDPLKTWLILRRDKTKKGQEKEERPDSPLPDTDDPALWILAPIYAAGFVTGMGVLWLLGIITIPMCPHSASLNVS